jgi:hypothetical protein
MADHLDAPGLMSPNMDASIDITDVYAFEAPDDAGRAVLVLSVNPLAPTLAASFNHEARYEIKVDTNGDARADITYTIRFSPLRNGTQQASVTRSGADGDEDEIIDDAGVTLERTSQPRITSSGGYEFFAGIRSDSFFFDLAAFLGLPPHAHPLDFTDPGSDFFIDKNVYSIVLSAPKAQLLGADPTVGVWARVLVKGDKGSWVQKDRMGRPAINTVFNHGNDKNVFNAIDPTSDVALFRDKFIAVLSGAPFNRDAATAAGLVSVLLPDILTYDYRSAGGFLNGRRLQDDVIDAELQLLTGSSTISDHVGPHSDYLGAFPYLGTPH